MKLTPSGTPKIRDQVPFGNRAGFMKSSDLDSKLVCLVEHVESSKLQKAHPHHIFICMAVTPFQSVAHNYTFYSEGPIDLQDIYCGD